ncbi:MAG: D-alanyl-D-alanine carboxypeptidase [Clostridia bacterium]|nr:D-alanyl-D-alanine carboxypeptidase [Clostridia bacterium]
MRLRKLVLTITVLLLIASTFSTALASDENDQRDWTGWVSSDNQLKDTAVNTAGSAIVVDINSGRIIYKKSAYDPMYPASTTKIMTCILALEHAELTDMVTVDDVAWSYIKDLDPDSTMIFLKKNEIVSVKDLLYGLMMASGNDAAVALACYVGGSYDDFINMMNLKAQEIGMKATHYANPHGLPDETHQTSARDMALLAMYARENYPEFNEIVGTEKYKPADTNLTSHSTVGTEYTNSNKLIVEGQQYYYQYATGIKTGYTRAAKSVLVSSAEKDSQSLVAVVMKDEADGKWLNSKTLFDYAFDFYQTIELSELFMDKEITATVANADMNTTGNQLTMMVGEGEKVYLTELKDLAESILADKDAYFSESIQYNAAELTAPINAGDEVGTVTYKYIYSHNSDDYLGYKAQEGEVQYFEYTAPLYAKNTINAIAAPTTQPTASPAPTKEPTKGLLGVFDLELWQIALGAIGVLFVILVILLIIFATSKGGANRRYNASERRYSDSSRGGGPRRRY